MIRGAIVSIIILGLGIFLYTTHSNSTSGNTTSILIDITDTLPSDYRFKLQELVHQTNTTIWSKRHIRLGIISDIEGSQSVEYILPSENMILGNRFERMDTVKQFELELNSAIDDILSLPLGRKQSSIYTRINEEIRELAYLSSEKKHLIVISNLEENTEQFSIFKSRPTPEAFLKIQEPQFASSLTIEFIYSPKTRSESLKFLELFNVYKTIYQPLGITVENTIFEQW